jgi:hypothetical protein
VDTDGISDLEGNEVGLKLFFFDGIDDVHDRKLAGNYSKVVG